MKASELTLELQLLIAEHGDHDVTFCTEGATETVTGVKFVGNGGKGYGYIKDREYVYGNRFELE